MLDLSHHNKNTNYSSIIHITVLIICIIIIITTLMLPPRSVSRNYLPPLPFCDLLKMSWSWNCPLVIVRKHNWKFQLCPHLLWPSAECLLRIKDLNTHLYILGISLVSCLPCEAAGFTRSSEDPLCQAEPQLCGPISVLWRTTACYGHGLGIMTLRKATVRSKKIAGSETG